MGKDMESIVSNPIGQPMATVCICCLPAWSCSSADYFDIRISDTFQQPRPQRDARDMDCRSLHTVGVVTLYEGSPAERHLQILDGLQYCKSHSPPPPSMLTCIIFFVQLIAASRQTFAFARDGALPCSHIIYRVNPYTRTPVNAVWTCVFIALLLGLLAFAGSAANSAIFSLSVAGQYTAFAIPIMCRFLGGKPWTPGPFTLGRFVRLPVQYNATVAADTCDPYQGLPVGVVAVGWMIFSTVIIAFPGAPAPDAQGMNYMSIVFGGWILLCLAYFYLPVYGGKYWFNGPQRTLEEARPPSDDGASAQLDGTQETSEKQ